MVWRLQLMIIKGLKCMLCVGGFNPLVLINGIRHTKSKKADLFLYTRNLENKRFLVQNYLLNLCFIAVNPQRLLCYYLQEGFFYTYV